MFDDHANRERAAAAFEELEAVIATGVDPPGAIDITDPQTLKLARCFQLTTSAGRLDVFAGVVPGADPYEELAARAVEIVVFGMSVRVVSLEDLLAMKYHAGRERDLQDIAALNDRNQTPPAP
jgi:hypothetical protein